MEIRRWVKQGEWNESMSRNWLNRRARYHPFMCKTVLGRPRPETADRTLDFKDWICAPFPSKGYTEWRFIDKALMDQFKETFKRHLKE